MAEAGTLRENRNVSNQPPPLEGYNLFTEDRALAEAVGREGGADSERRLAELGSELGGEPLEWGRLANESPPRLRTHDRFGERIDEVEFHPAWHALLKLGVENGIHARPWRSPGPGAHVERAAAFVLLSQAEAGVCCPLSMTHAAVPALRAGAPELAAEWEPSLTSYLYEPGLVPAGEKAGALAGMALTERQGGSDVRTNETVARPLGDGEAELSGSKWFCSAPMSDVFLVLAQAPAGLSCYLVPRVLPDGSRNRLHLMRLKDKLGNRSNASAEIELACAWGRLVDEEGRGVPAIAEMINHTRLDCALGSAAVMRRAVAEATHHAAHRTAFGARLAEQPLMRNVLADLCLESEAATALALRVARAYDEPDAALRRILTAVAKYWTCKVAPGVVGEALECLGGNGYVEESVLPRLYREAPLNSIWEGAGNVAALDVLRIVRRQPEALEAFLAELEPELRPAVDEVEEHDARRFAETLAVALQASLLLRHAPAEVADGFVAGRVRGERGRAYGTLPAGAALDAIVERHRPVMAEGSGVGAA
jgi:putative acyl-CoA dehydrogenase